MHFYFYVGQTVREKPETVRKSVIKMDIVHEVLNKSQEESKKFKSTTVKKQLDLYFDLGTLLALDENELDVGKLRSSGDSYLQSLGRDNTQLLINKIWELPTEKCEGLTFATLPEPIYVLPRAQPVPKPKQLTKWEKFAKEKNIVKKKKDKLKWDDILKKWVPLYGYRRADAEKEKDWVLEVPDNADPYEDQFAKKISEKSERTAKNEFQRLRNLAKAKNIKLPKLGFTPSNKPSTSTLGASMTVAKASTASLGKFQESLPKEKVSKVKQFLPGANKRKLPIPKPEEEKQKNMTLIDSILNKKPKLNIEQAVDKEVHNENRKEANSRKPKKSKKNSGRKTKKGAKGGKYRGPNKGSLDTPKKSIKTGGSSKERPRKGGKIKGGRKRR